MMDAEERTTMENGAVIQEESVAQETEAVVEPQAEAETQAEAVETTEAAEESAEATEEVRMPFLQTKEEVLQRTKEIAESESGSDRQELDTLKQLFYKYRKAELAEDMQAFISAGGAPENFTPRIDTSEEEFKLAMQAIRQRRAEQQAEQDRIKQENLQRKQTILDRIKELASTPEQANKTYDEFKALQAEWKEIKAVPAENATELWKNYQLYVEQFYDLLKLNSEMREYDFRKNLEIKTRLCEQAERLANEPDVISAFNQLQGLHQEYKETGPVSKELREEIWARFKAASTVVNKRHQDHFIALKEREEENLAKKTALCERMEAIKLDELNTFADWNSTTEQVLAAQAEWKTIGFAPQRVNQQIFDRFRSACDAFFQQKADFFRNVKDTLSENLAKKTALVEKAEALKDSTDWKATGDTLIQLQKEWKTIGAIPRKNSEALWKRFIGACDAFFEAKNLATADQRNEEQENLAKKKGIIEQLQALLENPEQNDAVQNVRALQQQWNETGHVPFRDKDKLYKQYREACDQLYKQFNISAQNRRLEGFKANLRSNIEKDGTSNLQREHNRMMRAYEALRSEIQTYENNIGFLSAKSKKGNSLVDEMQRKVDKQKEELALLAKKIKAVEAEMRNAE